jgi:hypothetical protein
MTEIKTLVKNILLYYKEKEEKDEKEKDFVSKKYFVHSEFDSNVTEFEGLSNENRILFYSSLNYIDVFVIMHLFQNIYDDNYYLFDEEFELLLKNEDISIDSNDDKDKLFDFNDSEIWIKYLTKYLTDSIDFDDEEIEENSRSGHLQIDNLNIYNKKPKIYNLGYKKKKNQKVYNINDIIELIV